MGVRPVNIAPAIRNEPRTRSEFRSISQIAAFVATVQLIHLLAHELVYQTWVFFRPATAGTRTNLSLAIVGALSISFVCASVIAHRYNNLPARLFYRVAAYWLGTLNFLFFSSCLCWLVYGLALALRLQLNRPALVVSLFVCALVASAYGVVNARRIRVKRLAVKLPNVPASWRGRIAAHITDTHLGHVNGSPFLRRIVQTLQQYTPDIVFITGDVYDGTKVDPDRLAAPWREIDPPFGSFFVTGNHEEFSDPSGYLAALRRAGINVLGNEKVIVEGLQIVGVYYHDSVHPARLRSILQKASIDRDRASVLLSHAPYGLSVANEAGVSLQLSGHTHGGQVFPFTWFTRRIFGEYTYGLKRFRELLVYTSTGAGTWGPPMRVGAPPEIVLIEFA
jgi:predicted MPP superfamily phosphohydrolase